MLGHARYYFYITTRIVVHNLVDEIFTLKRVSSSFMPQSSLLTLHSSLVFQYYTLLCLHLPVPHHIEAAIITWTQYKKLKRQRTAQRPVTRTQPLIRHQRQSSHLKMGLSLSRIYQSVSSLAVWGKDKEVRILMVGLDSAGKTTILYRLQVSLSCTRCRR